MMCVCRILIRITYLLTDLLTYLLSQQHLLACMHMHVLAYIEYRCVAYWSVPAQAILSVHPFVHCICVVCPLSTLRQ